MDPSIVSALIGAAAIVVVAVIETRRGKHLRTMGEDIAATREQVTNTHSTNLRDDVDRVFDAVDRLEQKVDDLGVQVKEVKEDIRESKRMEDDLEDTQRRNVRQIRTDLDAVVRERDQMFSNLRSELKAKGSL